MNSEPERTQPSESLYRHMFDSAPDVLIMINRKGDIQVANSRCRDVLGMAPGDLPGQPFRTLLASQNHSDFEVMLRGLCEGTEMPEVEVAAQEHNGSTVPMMLEIRSVEEEASGRFMVRLRDIRDIKMLEQEYRNLFDSIGDAVFIGEPVSGLMVQANRQACDLTGYHLGELLGKDYGAVHSETWEAIREEIDRSPDREVSGREMMLISKSGDRVPVETHLRMVPHDNDEVYIETVIDISERKALEKRMRELRAEWDSFIRHELRNPLTPILAFSQSLMEDQPELQRNPKVKQYLEAIWQGGKRIERLLDLTYEVQAYERGQILLDRIRCNIYDAIRGAIQDAALGVDVEEDEPAGRVKLIPHEGAGDKPELRLHYDPQKVQRAFTNMVKNALEHDPGDVTVRVTDDEDAVTVGVHNWGTPIPADRLQTIFEKFNTTKRDQKGTGLGTTIAKLFVQAHGGRVFATSSEEEGTTFFAVLPKSNPDEEAGGVVAG
jgi:two-component system, OmpR family, sensor histidine kinase VicK